MADLADENDAPENDARTYCGAAFGEVREGECECPSCVTPPAPTT